MLLIKSQTALTWGVGNWAAEGVGQGVGEWAVDLGAAAREEAV